MTLFVGTTAMAQEGDVNTEQDPLDPTEQEIGEDDQSNQEGGLNNPWENRNDQMEKDQEKFDDSQQLGQNEGKTQISPQALPAEVTESIATGDFADWKIAKAFKLDQSAQNPQQDAQYEIHFEDPQGRVETEMYNQEGKVVDA